MRSSKALVTLIAGIVVRGLVLIPSLSPILHPNQNPINFFLALIFLVFFVLVLWFVADTFFK